MSLAGKKIPVYAISGNHDSAIRFSDHSSLIETSGIHLAPEYDGSTKSFSLQDKKTSVNIYLLPFIKPTVVRRIFSDDSISDYTDACREAVSRMNVDTDEINILVGRTVMHRPFKPKDVGSTPMGSTCT